MQIVKQRNLKSWLNIKEYGSRTIRHCREGKFLFLSQLRVDYWISQAAASYIVIQLLFCCQNQLMKKSHKVIFIANFDFCFEDANYPLEKYYCFIEPVLHFFKDGSCGNNDEKIIMEGSIPHPNSFLLILNIDV